MSQSQETCLILAVGASLRQAAIKTEYGDTPEFCIQFIWEGAVGLPFLIVTIYIWFV